MEFRGRLTFKEVKILYYYLTKKRKIIAITIIFLALAYLLYPKKVNTQIFDLMDTIVFYVVSLVIFLSIILFVFLLVDNKKIKSIYKNETFQSDIEYIFDVESIILKNSRTESKYKWNEIIKIIKYKNLIIIFFNNKTQIVLSRSFFQQDELYNEFKLLVNNKGIKFDKE